MQCYFHTYIVKKFPRNLSIDSCKDVIENVNFSLTVDGAGQSKAGLLAARQVNATLSDYGHVAIGKKAKITTEAACVNNLVVPVFVVDAGK